MLDIELNNINEVCTNMNKTPHLEALRAIPGYFKPDMENNVSFKGNFPLKVVVLNIEQGTRLQSLLPFFQYHPELCDADIILANELDCGMHRSQNIDATRELGKTLAMNSAFGVEFITTSAGKNGNTQGLHGNAILSKYPLNHVKLIHLPILYDWFYKKGDSRLGVRMAVLAEIEPIPGKRMGIVCTHLENRAAPAQRLTQMQFLLDQCDAHFGDIPVLIGGDMNTNTVDGNQEGSFNVFVQNEAEQLSRINRIAEIEPLLDYAASRGYSYRDCNILSKVTRRKPMPDGSTIVLNLDWFFHKGLQCKDPGRIETIFHIAALEGAPQELSKYEGMEMTDHDAIRITVSF